MAEGGYSYVIELVDRISGPARTAKQQIDSLTSSLRADANEVRNLRNLYDALKATGQLTTEAERRLTTQIQSKEKAMQAATEKIRGMVAAEEKEAKAAADSAAKIKKASAEASGFGETISALGPYAAAAAAAILALGGAIVALTIAGAKLALDAALFKSRTLAALKSVQGTSLAAFDTYADIRRISDEIGISEKKAQELGLSLLDAGVAQKDLGEAIKAIALLEKVRGDQAAGKLQELIKKSAAAGSFKLEGESLVGTGLQTADVINSLAKRLGKSNAEVEAELKAGKISAKDGIAAINSALNEKLGDAKGLTSFEDATSKAFEMVTRLFEDVNTGPLIEAVQEIGSWFDQSTVAGGALKFIVTTIFDGLGVAAKEILPYIKVAFLELVIVALKIYIAFKPIVAQVQELWGKMTGAKAESSALGEVIKASIDVLVPMFGGLIFSLQIVLTAISQTIAIFQIFSGAASMAITFVTSLFSGLWSSITSLFSVEGATSIATSLIDGLVSGITGGAARVVGALTDVGSQAIGAVKGVLGIASPSRVMAEMGGFAAEGFAMGVEDGTAQTQGSLEAAVAPPAAPGGGAGGGIHVTIEAGAIVITGAGGSAESLAELLESKLQDMFESIAMQMGGATES